LRYADLRDRANLREANLTKTDLRQAFFDSISQPQRASHWSQAIKDEIWAQRITSQRVPPIVALIRSNTGTIFDSYTTGMKQVKDAGVMTMSLKQEGVATESKMIRSLIDQEVDAILLRPEDPRLSVPAIKAAYLAGIAVITI